MTTRLCRFTYICIPQPPSSFSSQFYLLFSLIYFFVINKLHFSIYIRSFRSIGIRLHHHHATTAYLTWHTQRSWPMTQQKNKQSCPAIAELWSGTGSLGFFISRLGRIPATRKRWKERKSGTSEIPYIFLISNIYSFSCLRHERRRKKYDVACSCSHLSTSHLAARTVWIMG